MNTNRNTALILEPRTGDSQVTERIAEASPRLKARIAGVVYLLTFVTGALSNAFIPGLVGGDAAATVTHIMTHQTSFWLGFAFFVLVDVTYIVVTALFYDLFQPVNRRLSLLAAFFGLVGLAVQAVACILLLVPIVLLGGAQSLSVFSMNQLHAPAYVSFSLFHLCFGFANVFFGCYCLLIGYLVFRSTYLPRILGVLMAFAGVGLLTFLVPPLASSLSPYNLALDILGEASLTLWLLVMGVNAERWIERTRAAGIGDRTHPDTL
jgi:hypothetical protein